jgi:hypothetical protein
LALLQTVQITEKKTGLQKFGKTMQPQQEYQQENDDEEFNNEDENTNQYIFMKPWMANVKEPANYYKDPIN